MKAIIISALVSLAVVEVFGGSLYGEKEEVQREVTEKFSEVNSYLGVVVSHIANEEKKTEPTAKEDAIAEAGRRKQIVETELKKEILASTRTAIAKGKPLAAIECIGNVAKDGDKLIQDTMKSHNKAVEGVLPNKALRLEFLKYETDLIKAALDGLKAEFDEKIKEAKTGFQALKSDGLKKTSTAKKQLGEIEARIDKPTLFDEYTNMKRKMENKFQDLKQSLIKRVQQCVA